MSFPIDLILVPDLDGIGASIEAGAGQIDLLNSLAIAGGAQPLDEFLSTAATLGADVMEDYETDDSEDDEDADEQIPESELHDPSEGVRSVEAILKGLRDRTDMADVVAELEDLRDALIAGSKAGCRFCLGMDL